MAGDSPSPSVDDDRGLVDATRHAVRDRVAVIDAGASSLRAAVFDGEEELTRYTEHLGLPHPGASTARTTIRDRIATVLERLGHGPYTAVVLATTGIRRLGDIEEEMREDLAGRLGTEVLLANDVVAAYLGSLGPAPGLLLHAGTGSLVLALPEEGGPVVLDGWGHLAGDRGSGFALGRAGLRAAFDSLDGLTQPTRLTELLLGRDPEQMITDLHSSSNQVRDVAAIAPHVLRAAAEGDATAQRLVEDSVGALVETGRAALVATGGPAREDPHRPEQDSTAASDTRPANAPLGTVHPAPAPLQVAGVGGLFVDAHYRSVLTTRVEQALPEAELHLGGGDALRGGLLLHAADDDPHVRALTRAFESADDETTDDTHAAHVEGDIS